VLEQAENRLHIQKAILAWLAGAPEARSSELASGAEQRAGERRR
jgi:hypothetical protein